ncbi:murein L,D-transpeptidase [Sagittula sp. NFXS13]|uniref:L,D-transpeptidase family protein n=1 Tax=Sagittula sp. NFXS13 TaxID=2819095 RepID=UPI0032DEAD9B
MRTLTLIFPFLLASPALALTPEEVQVATYTGGTLPEGQSGLTMKLQILLDRAGISPGVIDGYKGGMSESALRAFEQREGLPVDGILDPEVWILLGGNTAEPVLGQYSVTAEDVSGLTASIPDNVREKAQMNELGYLRVSERLAERYHMDEDALIAMNPQAVFAAGETIVVANPGAYVEGTVDRIEIHKGSQRAVALDAGGAVLANYPVAIGSNSTPSPSGTMQVKAVAMNPTYSYNPDVNFEADGVEEALTLPPGTNGPVGSVWIDLSKPTYGLHGTDSPAELFENHSHGCVRFTNWDVTELAHMVSDGVSVEFLE